MKHKEQLDHPVRLCRVTGPRCSSRCPRSSKLTYEENIHYSHDLDLSILHQLYLDLDHSRSLIIIILSVLLRYRPDLIWRPRLDVMASNPARTTARETQLSAYRIVEGAIRHWPTRALEHVLKYCRRARHDLSEVTRNYPRTDTYSSMLNRQRLQKM